jgi:hypothetical protein
MKPRMALILAVAALWSGRALSQSAPPATATDISKEAENPVTRVITLPLRYEADLLDGPTHSTKETFEIDQAVVPFRLNDDWSLITRTKLPYEAQPPKKLGESWADGLSNGYTTFFLSPEHGHDFYWGVGPVLYYPTATSSALGDGWSLGSSPNITTNWLASGGKWTVPAGGGFAKVVRLGAQPIKLELDAYYNAIRPKASNETWLLQAALTLLFPR